MFEEKIVKANEEIKKVVDYLKEHEEAFRSMNLKLYDASYYFMNNEMEEKFPLTYADNEKRGYNSYTDFDWFCEDSYNLFIENLSEAHGIDFSEIQHSVGTTSSFYLHDRNIVILDRRYEDIDIDETMNSFVDYYCNNQCGNYIEVNNNIIEVDEEQEDYSKEIENELDYIINNLYNDVINYCKDIITVYEIIKGFKDNQVEYFKEYLECQEKRLQEEKEEEEAIRKENKDKCINIKEKYNISDDEMEILKECIVYYE